MTKSESVESAGRFALISTRKAPWAPLLSPAQILVSLLPVAPDSVSGRDKARTIKVVLVATGLVCLMGAREVHALLALAGLFVMASAAFLPLSELQKRSWLMRLARAVKVRDVRHEPGRLEHDGRRLILWRGEERERRVLTNREFSLKVGLFEGRAVLCARPKGKGAREEAIWVMAPERVEGLGALDASSASDAIELDTLGGWQRIEAVLREAYEASTPRR